MKKFAILLLSLILFLTLVSCTDTSNNNEETKSDRDETTLDASVDTTAVEDTAENTPAKSGDTYNIALSNGLTVTIGGDSAAFISKAGEPIDYMEAPS